MNAYEIPNQRFSLPAGAAVDRFRFVSADANGAGIHATASTQVIGVSTNLVDTTTVPAAKQIVEIADGIVMVEAAGNVAAGAAVSSDANGKAVTATPVTYGDTSVAGSIVVGSALTGGGAGELITVKLI